MSKALLIYGASGYTARLITSLAMERGLSLVLAGRNEAKISRVAHQFQLPYRIFSLDDGDEARVSLEGIGAVLHCAGPFALTAAPMVAACLATRTHYLDITGEIEVFEHILARDAAARQARVVLVPGVGFDVVPTDCLAAMLAAELPGATHLELSIKALEQSSPGTARTMLAGLPEGGRERIGGLIEKVPMARKQKRVAFAGGEQTVYSIPWGDVSTAYHSTGIPNIATYMTMGIAQSAAMKVIRPVQSLLRNGTFMAGARRMVDLFVRGPNQQGDADSFCDVHGLVRDANGRQVEGGLRTPEAYRFTADAALRAAARVLKGDLAPGSYTPSKAFGADFVRDCDGVEVETFKSLSGSPP